MNKNLPKLLLHICCAPDEAYVIKLLKDDYELHCFFSNSNIYPLQEYQLRLDEARKVAGMFSIPFTADPYSPNTWNEAIKDLTDTAEGGARCRECFLLRMKRTAEFCSLIRWPAFTTVMSISPHKKISVLNETGEAAAAEYGISYGSFDFKKKDGFKKSMELSKELNLYRQNYCGCRLSLIERDKRNISA